MPHLERTLVHVLMKKNPNKPAEMFKEGMTPTVRFSLWVMMQNKVPNTRLTSKPLKVIWLCHAGISTPTYASSSVVPPSAASPSCWSWYFSSDAGHDGSGSLLFLLPIILEFPELNSMEEIVAAAEGGGLWCSPTSDASSCTPCAPMDASRPSSLLWNEFPNTPLQRPLDDSPGSPPLLVLVLLPHSSSSSQDSPPSTKFVAKTAERNRLQV